MRTRGQATATRHLRLAAICLLAGVACLAAIWIAPRTSRAAAAWLETTPVSVRTVQVSGGLTVRAGTAAARAAGDSAASTPAASAAAGSSGEAASTTVTLDAGMRFTMVGLICAEPSRVGAVAVRLRASADGASWSAWQELPLQTCESGEGSAQAYTDPLWTGSARYVQVSATCAATGAPEALTDVRVLAIDPVEDAGAAAAVLGTLRRAAAKVASIGLAAPAEAAVSAPDIVTRAEWGADESLRSGSPSYAGVKMAFVHHTASGNSYSAADGPALVRGIYAYHTSGLGWSDIGYNFLIDRYGVIYEGRYGGVERGVVGAQVLGFNTGSSGVSVIGTFTSVAPPAAAVSSLKALLAWKLDLHGLDPSGTVKMTCGATDKYKEGASVNLPVVAGHRDANYTACPGDKLYALLPSVRTAVAGLMKPKWSVALRLSKASVRKNANVTFRGSVTTAAGEPGSGTVTIQRRRASDGTWHTWRTARLKNTGGYALTVKMVNRQTWKLRTMMPGRDGTRTSYSAQKTLTVY